MQIQQVQYNSNSINRPLCSISKKILGGMPIKSSLNNKSELFLSKAQQSKPTGTRLINRKDFVGIGSTVLIPDLKVLKENMKKRALSNNQTVISDHLLKKTKLELNDEINKLLSN